MRALVFVGAATLGLIVGNTAGSQESRSEQLSIHRVAGNVYMIDPGSEGGGNIAMLVGDHALLLVDASGWVDPQPVLKALKDLSDKPVRWVVNTHCHRDHTAGNAAFQAAGATIVAHTNLGRRVEAQKCDGEVALPTLATDNKLTLHLDNEEVQVIALPTGHTDGDAMVYFKNANVLATGDAFVSSELPSQSRYAGGNMLGVNEELRRIVELFPNDVNIVPGHGPQSGMSEVRGALKVLDGIRDAVSQQIAQGKSWDQLSEMNLLDPWKGVLGDSGTRYSRWYYDFLTGPPDPKYQL
jgi:cyclase